jgi:hypothetical protein
MPSMNGSLRIDAGPFPRWTTYWGQRYIVTID